MKKVIILAISALLTIIVLVYASSTRTVVETNYEEIRALEIKKSDLLLEIDLLERDYDIRLNGKALVFLLFADFNTEYYDEITGLLDKYEYYGTLILSEECFPDKEGYLSVEQFNELIKKGWNYCILYDNEEQFDYLNKLFEVNGMKTDTVYFNKGKYNTQLDNKLKSLGYKSIVHHGENNINMYKDDIDNGIWHVGNMGIVGSAPKAKLLDTVEVYGAFSYTISFNKNNKEEYYDYETLDLVMDSFNTLVNKDALQVTDLERGYQYKKEITDNYKTNKDTYTKQKEKLNKELKEIEKQIKELESE